MNIIQSIQKSEDEAEEIIRKAQKNASTVVSEAQKEGDAEISALKKTLRENEERKTDKQKVFLAKLYKEITKDGKKEISKITEKKDINQKNTVKFILNNI